MKHTIMTKARKTTTDKLLLEVFTQLFFWNTQLFFKLRVHQNAKDLMNTQLK